MTSAESVSSRSASSVGAAEAGAPPTEDALREDALSALLNLGYQKAAAEKAVTQAMTEGGELSVELLLRRSLRHLSKG